ncbi:MAG: CBS domain-containing protein [Desulfomonilaceae bacterium]
MADTSFNACAPVQISDDDIFTAMREISGYLDITPSDFKELYLKAYDHALSRLIRVVRVREIMTTTVIAAKPEFSLEKVAELMAINHISGLPVVDDHEKPLGVISERDFLEVMVGRKSANLMEIIVQCLKGKNCLMTPVRIKSAEDIMTSPAIIVRGDNSVDDVSKLFASKGVNRAPVVDSEQRVIGIVTRGDLMKAPVVGSEQ